jgi:hypothetical protein
MLNKAFKLVLLPAAAAVLAACGGGANSQRVGQFVDDPVEGLTYQCAAPNSTSTPSPSFTNAQGQFNYTDGQVCTFRVGNVVLGSPVAVPTDGLVTPQDVAGVVRTATSAPSVTAIAQFLQSLSEPGTTGKLKISSQTTEALSRVDEVQLVSSTGPLNQEKLGSLVVQTGKTLISPTQAASNLSTQLDKLGVSKTVGAVSTGSPAKLLYVSVSAPSASIAAGATLKLTATGNLSNGDNSIVSSAVTWSSANTSLATVSNDGTVTTLKPGVVKLTATTGDKSGVFELNVTDAVLQSLSVPTGVADALPLGLTKALSLTGKYSDGSEKTLSSGVTWTVSNDKASVDANGLLTSKGIGEVVVTGTIAGVSKDFPLTVSGAVLQSFVVSRKDDSSAPIAVGRTVELKVLGKFSDNSSSDISKDVTWTSSNDTVAVLGGVLTTQKIGNARISASSGNLTAGMSVDVGPAELVSLAISTPEIKPEGLNQNLVLTGTYTDKTTATNLVNVVWSSADTSKVTVATNGNVVGKGVGSAKVTATVGGVSTDVTVTVTDPVAKSLTASSVLQTIADGASTVINAMATLTNDSVVAVAKSVNWVVESLGGQAVISITGDTVSLRGTSPGVVKVIGEIYQGIFANFNVTVTPVLSGTAAVGAPMGGASIVLTDKNGNQWTTTANDRGSYTFSDLTGAVAPFQVTASVKMGDTVVTHYALVTESGADRVANVTPLTTAVTALVAPTDVPMALTAGQISAITAEQIAGATTKIKTAIAPLASNLQLGPYDPTTSSFTANRQGIDLLLDHINVTVRPEGITLANKMAVTAESQNSTSANGSTINKNSSVAITPISNASVTQTSGLDELAAKVQDCFTVASAQRLVVSDAQNGTLHSKCADLALPNYLHNGTTFKMRWAAALKSSTMDGSTYLPPVVRLRVSESPERLAINFNFQDNLGAGYTRPEIVEKQQDGTWKLYGNQRKFNAYSESSLIYYDDLAVSTTFNNVNSSHVESGLRFLIDPRTFMNGDGSVTYPVMDLTKTGGYATGTASYYSNLIPPTGSKKIGCVVITGPGEVDGFKWAGFPTNGILLKPPTASDVQDYMAIDRVLTNAARTAITNATPSTSGASSPVSFPGVSNICNWGGSATTNSSSPNYVTDIEALGQRKNVLTGAMDSAIAGRDVAWNTGARYARKAASTDLKKVFDSNPLIQMEIFDTDGRLRHVIKTRYLGEIPPAKMAEIYVNTDKVSKFNTASLARYLDFTSGGTDTQNDVSGSITAQWTTAPGAFGADRINLYSEIYRSQPGQGIRNTVNNSALTSSLWGSDPDLATYLNNLPGTNFFWWNGNFANQYVSGNTGSCRSTASTFFINTTGVNVGRSTTSINSSNTFDGSLWGVNSLTNNACITAPGSNTPPSDYNAYVLREMSTRTYTDTNTRLYYIVTNRKFLR